MGDDNYCGTTTVTFMDISDPANPTQFLHVSITGWPPGTDLFDVAYLNMGGAILGLYYQVEMTIVKDLHPTVNTSITFEVKFECDTSSISVDSFTSEGLSTEATPLTITLDPSQTTALLTLSTWDWSP